MFYTLLAPAPSDYAQRMKRIVKALRTGGQVSLLALALSWLLACSAEEPPAPTADRDSLRWTETGPVVGFASEDDAYVWRGIPFAKPPIGFLRWRAPEPLAPWEGVLEALEFGPSRTVTIPSSGPPREYIPWRSRIRPILEISA